MKTLEETLEELAPTPDPEFVREMERRMQLGFPPERKPRFSWPKLSARPAAALTVATVGLIALVTVVAVTGERERGRDEVAAVDAFSEPEQQIAPAVPLSTGQPEIAQDSSGGAGLDEDSALRVAPARRSGGEIVPGRSNRQVERSAQIALAADPGEFDDIADSVFAITARRGGFVLRSDFTQGEQGVSAGFFELRVPVNQLEGTLNAISRLASVRTRSESANDVTGRFVTVTDRLQIALAERKSLLTRLGNATTALEAQSIRRRLEIVSGEINGLRSRLRRMRERTDYAAVSVELMDEDSGAAEPNASDTDEAFDDAVGSLEDILNFLIRALGIVIPVGIAALLGWLGFSRARRHARERALA